MFDILKSITKINSAVLIPVTLFLLPVTFYFYAVVYETAYLESFSINKEYAQINPLVLSDTFTAILYSLIATLVLAIIILLIKNLILNLHILLLKKRLFPNYFLKQAQKKKSKSNTSIIRTGLYICAIWLVFSTFIPVCISFVAKSKANDYLQNHSCVTVKQGEAQAMLVRQYNDMLILREYDTAHNAVVLSSGFRVIKADNAYQLNTECHKDTIKV